MSSCRHLSVCQDLLGTCVIFVLPANILFLLVRGALFPLGNQSFPLSVHMAAMGLIHYSSFQGQHSASPDQSEHYSLLPMLPPPPFAMIDLGKRMWLKAVQSEWVLGPSLALPIWRSFLYIEAAELSGSSPGVDQEDHERTCSRIHKTNMKTNIRAEVQIKATTDNDSENLDPAVSWLFAFVDVFHQDP